LSTDDIVRSAIANSEQAQGSLHVLLRLENKEDLYVLLGQRVQAATRGATDTASFDMPFDPDNFQRSSSLRELGHRIFRRWSRTLHEFVCNPTSADKDIRDRLWTAITSKESSLVALTAGVLVATFGVSPAVAAVVAALLVRVVFNPATDEVCRYWSEQLERDST
jgi:hypothetical protein